MNLWLVTFELDYSQFLVNAKNIEEAIAQAIKANKGKLLGDWSPEERPEEVIEDCTNYDTYHVDDMNILYDIIKRDDWVGVDDNVIVFFG